jgi:hypothetical protein
MKPLCRAFVALLFVSSALTLTAQNYQIDWYTIDGGGGTSSGGPFTLSGTIGQPDAGTLSGGNYVLEGGFWGGVFAVQQVGAPTLHIERSANNVLISWDPPTPGFFLQESATVSPTTWSNSASGATNPTTAPASIGDRFYRLSNH